MVTKTTANYRLEGIIIYLINCANDSVKSLALGLVGHHSLVTVLGSIVGTILEQFWGKFRDQFWYKFRDNLSRSSTVNFVIL